MKTICPRCNIEIEAENIQGNSVINCPNCSCEIRFSENAIRPGTVINSYTIQKQIGSGGMGDVWLAKHNTMDRNVAIKTLCSKYSGNRHFIERFLNEVRVLAKLHHPNIVTAYDAGEYRGIYYLVMNYIQGTELDHLVHQKGHLSEVESLLIISQLADALSYAWSNFKIIHRDIKPGNIMVTSNSKPYLMDLGISKCLEVEKALTLAGSELFGTPEFMSPEQAKNLKEIDCRSDIYSLGATLFFMLTGKYPYQGETPLEVALKHVNEPVPSPRQINPIISPTCDSLVRKMMSKSPEERQASWQLVIKEIEIVIFGKTTTISSLASSSNRKTILTETKKPSLISETAYQRKRTLEQKELKFVPLDTDNIFAKKKNTKEKSPQKNRNTKNKLALLILIICFGIISSAYFTYLILSQEKAETLKKSSLMQESVKSDESQTISNLAKSENFSYFYGPKEDIQKKTENDQIVSNKKTSEDDEQALIAKIFGIPYPPPEPTKSIEEIEAMVEDLTKNQKEEIVFDEEAARKKAMRILNLVAFPNIPEKSFEEVAQEIVAQKEEYMGKNMTSMNFDEDAVKKKIEEKYKKFKDISTPLCSKEEALKRFHKFVMEKFYEELNKRGIISPLDTSLANEKKVLALIGEYKRIKREIINEYSNSFFIQLGYFKPSDSKDQDIDSLFIYDIVPIASNFERFVKEKLLKEKIIFTKRIEAEKKRLEKEFLAKYQDITYRKYGYSPQNHKSHYELAQNIIKEQKRAFYEKQNPQIFEKKLQIQEKKANIAKKLFTENKYIFFQNNWISYKEYLNKITKDYKDLIKNNISQKNLPVNLYKNYIFHQKKLIDSEKVFWKLLAIYFISGSRKYDTHLRYNYPRLFDKYDPSYFEYVRSNEVKILVANIRSNLLEGNIEDAMSEAKHLKGDLSEAFLSLINNFSLKIASVLDNSFRQNKQKNSSDLELRLFFTEFLNSEFDVQLYDTIEFNAEIELNGNLYDSPVMIIHMPNGKIETKLYSYFLEKLCMLSNNHESDTQQNSFSLIRQSLNDQNYTSLFQDNYKKIFKWKGELFNRELQITSQQVLYINGEQIIPGVNYKVSFFPESVKIINYDGKPIFDSDLLDPRFYSQYLSDSEQIKSIGFSIDRDILMSNNQQNINFGNYFINVHINNPLYPETDIFGNMHYSEKSAESLDAEISPKLENWIKTAMASNAKRKFKAKIKKKNFKENYQVKFHFNDGRLSMGINSDGQRVAEFNLSCEENNHFSGAFESLQLNTTTQNTSPFLNKLINSNYSKNWMMRNAIKIYAAGFELVEPGTLSLNLGDCEAELRNMEQLIAAK